MFSTNNKFRIKTQPARWMNDGCIAFSDASIMVKDTVPHSFITQLRQYMDDGRITLHTSRLVPTGK